MDKKDTKKGLVCIVLIESESEKVIDEARRLTIFFKTNNFEIFENGPQKDISSKEIENLLDRFMHDPRDLPRIFFISTLRHGDEFRAGNRTLFRLHDITSAFSNQRIEDALKSVPKLIVFDGSRSVTLKLNLSRRGLQLMLFRLA